MLLHITYDHTHLKIDLHPTKTMQCTRRSKYWLGSLKAEYKNSEHLWYNLRQQRERLSLFDLWFDWDYFSRSLTSRSGSRDTNIQESDDGQRSSVRFSIACRKGCSEFFIKRSVFEESSKYPIPTNKHLGQSIPLSVAGELLNAS